MIGQLTVAKNNLSITSLFSVDNQWHYIFKALDDDLPNHYWVRD